MEITGLKKHILCMKKPDIVRTQRICYNVITIPAMPLTERLCTTGRVFLFCVIIKLLEFICYNINNSTRRASDRKVKQAGLFIWVIVSNIFNFGIELIEFICYNINNKPATPLNLRVKAHFRQAFFLGGNI